ncbi:MAG: TetR/AcrR family transcriptional regulator [Actinomycetota bacterium]|nr:TetR/AcrR family transcriptional regulator [Actinomycetota bacterium]
MSTTESAARAPGRPRNPQADRAILEAAMDRFIADGYQAMSIEQVAVDAKVGKTTIYRRWPSKEALVADAVARLSEELPLPDTGSVRGDLLALVHEIAKRSSSTAGRCMGRVFADMQGHPEMAAVYKRNVVEPRRALIRSILERGVERGELRDDLDLDLVIDMLVGPIVFRRLIARDSISKPLDQPELLIDTLERGISKRR